MKLFNIISVDRNTHEKEIIGQELMWEEGEGGKTIGEWIYANMDIVAKVGRERYPEWRTGEWNRGLIEMGYYDETPRFIHMKTLMDEEIK